MIVDEYNLQRFLDAQNDVYDQVFEELRNGRKRSHWMWFIFPQIKGLGLSSTSNYFAISSKEEATAYLTHAILGGRLKDCTGLVLELDGHGALDLFGDIDAQKLASSMTLIANVTDSESVYQKVLDMFFKGNHDERTLDLLND